MRPQPHLIIGSATTIHIKTNNDKSTPIRFHSNKTTHYHKNYWQHKHGQYNSGVGECS
jgi:hypothetical protein